MSGIGANGFQGDSSPEFFRKVGNRIRYFRKKKGYSNYEQFAHDHNISRAQYGRYENGADIRLSTLLKVIAALNTTFVEFFGEGFDQN